MNQLDSYLKTLETTTRSRKDLAISFLKVREKSLLLCKNLEVEDFVVQPSPEVSPPKWHLAHTTWFFEELILRKFRQDYKPFNPEYSRLFNSYYKLAGQHWLQGNRGFLSRPSVKDVFEYRTHVDKQVIDFLHEGPNQPEVDFLLEVGLHHEMQHQELLIMDIKNIFGTNPLLPVFSSTPLPESPKVSDLWKDYSEGLYQFGHDGGDFAYDNEGPSHKAYIYPFSIRINAVSNGEYLNFIEDQGYKSPQNWLSEGWDWVKNNKIVAPMYWIKQGEKWFEYTLHGLRPLDLNSPVTHISYFEAHAYAHWTGLRLPTEFEAEMVLKESHSLNDIDDQYYHPTQTNQLIGQTWFWTRSQYSPYPRFRTFKGMLFEYNGKFMCNQFVLRGGCVATPSSHYRPTYRNFYQPHQRWMFSGIRLVRDL